MSRVSALFAPLLIASLGFPALAHAQTWENGQPVFRGDSSRNYARQRYYQPYQGYQRRGYDSRWGNNQGWGWGYDPRGYDQRYQQLDQRRYPQYLTGGPRPNISPEAPPKVAFANQEAPGTIIIDNSTLKLYYTVSKSEAYAYPISIGREGFAWTGTEKISRVADWPSWHPPAEMRARQPGLPVKMEGGVNNPLGVKALYLGDTLYRIHGTNDAKTIGRAASSGCFRMLNKHVLHLASLTKIGTTVKVVNDYPTSVAQAEPAGEAGSETSNQ